MQNAYVGAHMLVCMQVYVIVRALLHNNQYQRWAAIPFFCLSFFILFAAFAAARAELHV